jgi:RNase H-like domain found in reverse transcriptase/Reverse transcriptase (RNA-dependent DNA polymerase)/Integrase zinc binding domain
MTPEKNESIETQPLVNSGAGGIFMDQNYARKHRFNLTKLEYPITAWNVDRTENKQRAIRYYTDLDIQVNSKTNMERFFITGLGNQKIILGLPWLQEHNPEINWKEGTLQWRTTTMEEVLDEEEHLNRPVNTLDKVLLEYLGMENELWINLKENLATKLASEANQKKPDLTPEQLVPREYHDYLDIFDEDKANRFPDTRPWDHKIKMKSRFEPKSFKTYNLTPEEQVELDKLLKENLDKGYIKLSQSPMASPFFFVKKKDRKLRPCQDYRYLNDWTVKNAYPLPLISEIMDKIKGAKFFTKFNVRWGYNNVRIKAEDQWKAAFKTNRGLFKPMVMFFEMCNSPVTFQAMMDSIFSNVIEERKVIVYMDNILIFAENQEELQEQIKQMLQRLREHDLFLKPKKCEFNKTTMEYLGLIIQEGKLLMDPVKLSGIRDWPTPTMVKQVRGFIGFVNFYRRFIKKFSELVLPLNNLLWKDTKFDWNNQCQEAFKTLKGRFLQEPVLMMPDHSKPFQIESDTSKYASGAVLTQMDINGDRHPVAFLLKTFTDMEHWYEIYDRELLGIVRALKEWWHYIQGLGHTTLIHTDHQNLTYFRKAQKLSDWQARWSLFLSEFDIKLQHLPGNKIILSDALSRRPDHCPEEEETKEEILLPDDLFLNLLDINLRDRITKNKNYDFNVTKAIELLQEEGPTSIQNDLEDWKIEEVDDQKTIFYKGKQYIPKDQELRRDILKLFHDHEMAGHPGELETYNSVKQHYWWPGLRVFVKNYVKGCGICQQFKIDQNPSHPSLIPVEGAISTRPFAHCSMDLITDLPPAEESDSILVVVDQGLLKG